MSSRRSSVSTTASARMEKRPSVSPRMFSESSLTAFDPEVVAPAERAAETGCSEASSASLVSSIEVGPGIEFSAGDAAHGVLPLVAERAPSLKLPVWAGGASMWTPSSEGRTIPSLLSLISYTIYSNCTAIHCTILLFEYALITIGETASFSKGCSRVCLLGLHAATSP